MTMRSWMEHQVECDGCHRLGPPSGDSPQVALKLVEVEGWVADMYVANCPACRDRPLNTGMFFDQVRSGDATPATFNAAVDMWVHLGRRTTLAEHLGMTESQYQFFLESPTELGVMLRSRVQT